jgi:Cys-tRNA(Pro)/Cys-tRNA(Cys) deacylase
MRFLEQHQIAYESFEFDDSIHSAEGVAEALDVPAATVYKTLVVMPDDGSSSKPMLVLLSAGRTLDLKKFAKGAGLKKVRMAKHDEAEKLTSLKVGGISALALTAKNWPVFIDQPATDLEQILMSAGQRGLNLRLGVQDFIKTLKVTVLDCSRLAETDEE